MSTVRVPLVMKNDGSLAVPINGIGEGSANVTYAVDQVGSKTALINFNGANQALCTFDTSGTKIVSTTYLDVAGSLQVQQTVQNIIRYLNASQ